jgi:hypothetical protein
MPTLLQQHTIVTLRIGRGDLVESNHLWRPHTVACALDDSHVFLLRTEWVVEDQPSAVRYEYDSDSHCWSKHPNALFQLE